MYAAAEHGTPHFQRIRGNAASRSVHRTPFTIKIGKALTKIRFIDWGLQNQYDEEGNEITPRPTKPGDEEDEERFAAWREGRTGFPSVPFPTLAY